jgi:hypothetical protein
MPICNKKTLNGKICKRLCVKGKKKCWQHLNKKAKSVSRRRQRGGGISKCEKDASGKITCKIDDNEYIDCETIDQMMKYVRCSDSDKLGKCENIENVNLKCKLKPPISIISNKISDSEKYAIEIDNFMYNLLEFMKTFQGKDLINDSNKSPLPYLIFLENFNKFKEIMVSQQPNFTNINNINEILYNGIELISSGGEYYIFKTRVTTERKHMNLITNSEIVLRPKRRERLAVYTPGYYLNNSAEAMILTNFLSEGSKSIKPVSEYFPKIYGIYMAQRIEEKIIKKPLHEKLPDYWKDLNVCQQVEMEWMDGDMQEYKEKVPDSYIFEGLLGEWAGVTLAGIRIADQKPRNQAYKKVNYSRAYHMKKQILLFPASIIPKKIDLYPENIMNEKLLQDFKYGHALYFLNPINFVNQTNKYPELQQIVIEKRDYKEFFKQLLESFNKYVTTQKIVDLIPEDKIKHFYIPDVYLN